MKRRVMQVLLPGAVLAAGMVITSTSSLATPAYAKKEKTGCVTCHVTAGKKDLNDTGKCYKENQHTDLKACLPKK